VGLAPECSTAIVAENRVARSSRKECSAALVTDRKFRLELMVSWIRLWHLQLGPGKRDAKFLQQVVPITRDFFCYLELRLYVILDAYCRWFSELCVVGEHGLAAR